MPGIKLKLTKHVIKQENVTHNQEKIKCTQQN